MAPLHWLGVGACCFLCGLAVAAPVGSKISPAAERALAARDPGRLWIYFTDKDVGSPQERQAALVALEASYDRRAIERRRLRRTRPGLFDESDLPIAARYRAAVAATGAAIHVEVPWLNALSVKATPGQARSIASLPFVRTIEPVLGGRRLTRPDATETPRGGIPPGHTDDFYGLAREQLDQINLVALHGQGFTGRGVRIGVLDTGFKRTHLAFNDPTYPLRVIAEHDFVNGDPNTAPEPNDDPNQHYHGTAILGALGACKPNELVAGAYEAWFILCKTEDITSETPIEEDHYAAGLQFIEAHGGDVATASLVYIDWYTYAQLNGQTAVSTIAVNMATANGVYCCNAAGNGGHDNDPTTGHLGGAPADAFQTITVGAVSSEGSIIGFSSDGPTGDGRLKPEVLARGGDTFTVDPGDDLQYANLSGTSMATPLAASAVACLVQARPWWTVNQMRSYLFARASDQVANGRPDPLMIRGYGIIDAAATLTADCYADCDGSAAPPALNVNDFVCFQSRFAAASPYADCDHNQALNVNDFICFQASFAGGCP